MATTQYIGARYVPLFAEPLDWNNTTAYEPLTIVYYAGNSYTSRQAVPKGIDITNEKYWALTGNYNAQIEQYRKEVQEHDGKITQNAKDIAAEVTNRIAADTTLTTNLNAEVTRAKAAESALTTNLNAEVTRAKAAESALTTNVNSNSKQLNATVNSGLLSNAILNSGPYTKQLSLTKMGTLTCSDKNKDLNSITVDSNNNIYALFSKTGYATLVKYDSNLTRLVEVEVGDIHGNSMNYRSADNRIYILGYGEIASVDVSNLTDIQTVTTNLPFQSFAFDETNNLILGNVGGTDTMVMYRVKDDNAYIIGYKVLNVGGLNYAQDSCLCNGRYLTNYGYTADTDSPFVFTVCDIYGNLKQVFTVNKNFIDEKELEGIAVSGDNVLVASITGNLYKFSSSNIVQYNTNTNKYVYNSCWYIPNFTNVFYEYITTTGGTKILIRTPYDPFDTLAQTTKIMEFDIAKNYRYGGHGTYVGTVGTSAVKIQYNHTNGYYWLRYIAYGNLGSVTFEENATTETYQTELDKIFTTNIGNITLRGYGSYPFDSLAKCMIKFK